MQASTCPGEIQGQGHGEMLTQGLPSQHPPILSQHSCPGMALIGILDKGIALVHRTAGHTAILGEDGLHIRLLHHSCVEVSDENPRVDGFGVILVGYVACLDLQGHGGHLKKESHCEAGNPGWAQGLPMAHNLTKLDCFVPSYTHAPTASSFPIFVHFTGC